MVNPGDALPRDQEPIDTPTSPPVLPPPDFGGPNTLMDANRAEADRLEAEVSGRPRDEKGRFASPEPVKEVTKEPEAQPSAAPAVPVPSAISFEVATIARQAGFPQEWIDKAPSDDFVLLAVQGLRSRMQPSSPAPASPVAAERTKLELVLDDEELNPQVTAGFKKIVEYVNERDSQYAKKLQQGEARYAALKAEYDQLQAAGRRTAAYQEARVLDEWVASHPGLEKVLGKASDALDQLDENGFPTTDQAFQWRKVARAVGVNVKPTTPEGRIKLDEAAKRFWPEAMRGTPERNSQGALPPGASIRPGSKGVAEQPQSVEAAELGRLREAFAEVGARDANDWYIKTNGKPLPI